MHGALISDYDEPIRRVFTCSSAVPGQVSAVPGQVAGKSSAAAADKTVRIIEIKMKAAISLNIISRWLLSQCNLQLNFCSLCYLRNGQLV